ncbi:MAG TPA: hypothetical protein VNX22_05820, partial [Acidobacteriaceae bacterium]|nr:hypothetical protein [Acidobacteriaceae bacterium]
MNSISHRTSLVALAAALIASPGFGQAPAQRAPQTSDPAPAAAGQSAPAPPQTSDPASANAGQSSPTPPAPAADASKSGTPQKQANVKQGSLDDVNSIGTRDPGK